jgi:hypothetical protein
MTRNENTRTMTEKKVTTPLVSDEQVKINALDVLDSSEEHLDRKQQSYFNGFQEGSEYVRDIYESDRAALLSKIAELEEREKWVDVNDRLPEIGVDPKFKYASAIILLSDGKLVYCGQYENEGDEEIKDCFIDSNGDAFSDAGIIITRWQSLPTSPTTKEQ